MDIVVVGLIISGLAVVAAGAVIIPTRRTARLAKIAENVAQFKRVYEELRTRQTQLGEEVLSSSAKQWTQADIPMLAKSGWILKHPLPLDTVGLTLREPPQPVDSLVEESRILSGLALPGPITYSNAVIEIAGMQHFTNGVIYRPTAVHANGTSLSLEFEEARYFDYLDTSEVLAYEKASTGKARYRAHLEDPFDLSNRIASLGILTLTIKCQETGCTFLMHKRTSNVVVGSGLFHVLPAGEFTPSDVSLEAVRKDLSLWRNIAREYAEEILGAEDAQGFGGRSIDYQNQSPYKELAEATSAGSLRISSLGLGLDPLTWKPELLTVAVFEDESFDSIFGGAITGNYEGTVIEDIPYCEENVQHYMRSKNTRLGAKACLQLSWKHRDALGLN